MTLTLWNCESCSKLQKTLTKKRRLEASWGRFSDLLWLFGCQKQPVSWLKILQTHSTTNSSENTRSNQFINYKSQSSSRFNLIVSSLLLLSSEYCTEDTLSRVSIMPDLPTWCCSAVLDFTSCSKNFQLIAMENDRCSNFIELYYWLINKIVIFY